LDELWKQESKNTDGRIDILTMIIKSTMNDSDRLEQLNTKLEKRIQELEANVVSSSSSSDSEDKKHNVSIDSHVKEIIKSAYHKSISETKNPHIGGARLDQSDEKNSKKLKDVFKYWNYYSRDQMEKKVSEQFFKWQYPSALG